MLEPFGPVRADVSGRFFRTSYSLCSRTANQSQTLPSYSPWIECSPGEYTLQLHLSRGITTCPQLVIRWKHCLAQKCLSGIENDCGESGCSSLRRLDGMGRIWYCSQARGRCTYLVHV